MKLLNKTAKFNALPGALTGAIAGSVLGGIAGNGFRADPRPSEDEPAGKWGRRVLTGMGAGLVAGGLAGAGLGSLGSSGSSKAKQAIASGTRAARKPLPELPTYQPYTSNATVKKTFDQDTLNKLEQAKPGMIRTLENFEQNTKPRLINSIGELDEYMLGDGSPLEFSHTHKYMAEFRY